MALKVKRGAAKAGEVCRRPRLFALVESLGSVWSL